MTGRYGNSEKALRITFFPPPGVGGPETTVMLASDIQVSPEQVAAFVVPSGVFAVVDIFDVPTGTSAISAGVLGAQRMRANAKDEENMATAYYWWTDGFGKISGQGLIIADRPAPFSSDQLADVLRQVALHPNYVAQTIQAFDRDGTSVRLEAGTVIQGGPPVGPRGYGGHSN